MRFFVIILLIVSLIAAPSLAFLPGRSSPFAVKTVRSTVGNSSLITFHSSLLSPQVEHRLLIKFRDEASSAQRLQVIENYGEMVFGGQGAVVGGSQVMTLRTKANVSTALLELSRMDRVIEWVEPDYVTGVRGKRVLPQLPLITGCQPERSRQH